MHMHVDNLAFAGGHTYLGVQFAFFFQVREIYLQHNTRYHAVNWYLGDPADVRVNDVNQRAHVIECDHNENDRWWVGHPQATTAQGAAQTLEKIIKHAGLSSAEGGAPCEHLDLQAALRAARSATEGQSPYGHKIGLNFFPKKLKTKNPHTLVPHAPVPKGVPATQQVR
jgi:hypothetical protein